MEALSTGGLNMIHFIFRSE